MRRAVPAAVVLRRLPVSRVVLGTRQLMSSPVSAPTLPWDTPLESRQPANRPSRYHLATRAKRTGAPWQGNTPQSAHASYQASKAVMASTGSAIDQATRYWTLLVARTRSGEGLTDWEAHEILGIERSSVNARRNQLSETDPGRIYSEGFRLGPTGKPNAVWFARLDREPGQEG